MKLLTVDMKENLDRQNDNSRRRSVNTLDQVRGNLGLKKIEGKEENKPIQKQQEVVKEVESSPKAEIKEAASKEQE